MRSLILNAFPALALSSTMSNKRTGNGTTLGVPLITLEEHFLSGTGLNTLADTYAPMFANNPSLREMMADVGDLRLEKMDAGQVTLQVVSHGPGSMSAADCRSANDQLAGAVAAHPTRFAGFAVLPMSEPEAAATELRRSVTELGFVGALVDNHINGTFYDGAEYDVVWQAAQDLDVPIYLHPTFATEEMVDMLYSGNFNEAASFSIRGGGYGWHTIVGLHVLRLYASGTFDHFPGLKLIVGHMGEVLPYMLDRVSPRANAWGNFTTSFRDVYARNIWITTSGDWSVDPMATIVRNTPMDHVLYSVDYPFSENEEGAQYLADLRASGIVTEDQFKMIAYRNAEDLLGVKTSPVS